MYAADNIGGISMMKLTNRAMLLYLMLSLGFLTLTTGLILLQSSHVEHADSLILSELDKSMLAEWHSSIGFITAMLIVAHLYRNRRAVFHYAKTTLGKT